MPLTGAGDWPHEIKADETEGRPIEELVTSGVLWAINEEMFWPYGAALALHVNSDGKVTGWSLKPSPDGTRVDVPKDVKDQRWADYTDTMHTELGWEPGW